MKSVQTNLHLLFSKIGLSRDSLTRIGKIDPSALIFICVVFSIGVCVGLFDIFRQSVPVYQQQEEFEALQQRLQEKSNMLAFIKTELEVERMTSMALKNKMSELIAENQQQIKELSIYQKVMAPELEKEGIFVESFLITPIDQSKRNYRYELVLMQKAKRRRFQSGKVILTLSGKRDDKPTRYRLHDLNPDSTKNQTYKFKYFQAFEGKIKLPESFEVDMVQIRIMPKKKGPASLFNLNWQNLLTEVNSTI